LRRAAHDLPGSGLRRNGFGERCDEGTGAFFELTPGRERQCMSNWIEEPGRTAFAATGTPIRRNLGVISRRDCPPSFSTERVHDRGMVGRDWRTNGGGKTEAGGNQAAWSRFAEASSGRGTKQVSKSAGKTLEDHCEVMVKWLLAGTLYGDASSARLLFSLAEGAIGERGRGGHPDSSQLGERVGGGAGVERRGDRGIRGGEPRGTFAGNLRHSPVSLF